MTVRIRDIDLEVDAEVVTDESYPDRQISCSVEVREVREQRDAAGRNPWALDILPLLAPEVLREIEEAIRRQAVDKFRRTVGRA